MAELQWRGSNKRRNEIGMNFNRSRKYLTKSLKMCHECGTVIVSPIFAEGFLMISVLSTRRTAHIAPLAFCFVRLAVLCLCLSGFLLSGVPVHAGYWQVTKCVSTGTSVSDNYPMSLTYSGAGRVVQGMATGLVMLGSNREVDINAQSVTTLTYIRSAGETTYPKTVSILLNTSARVQDYYRIGSAISDVPLLVTNLDDPVVQTIVYDTNAGIYYPNWSKSTKRIVIVPATNGVATVVYSAHIYQVSTTSGHYKFDSTYSFTVKLDNRVPFLFSRPSGPWTRPNNDNPQDQELEAYARLDWFDDGVDEHPLTPFSHSIL